MRSNGSQSSPPMVWNAVLAVIKIITNHNSYQSTDKLAQHVSVSYEHCAGGTRRTNFTHQWTLIEYEYVKHFQS